MNTEPLTYEQDMKQREDRLREVNEGWLEIIERETRAAAKRQREQETNS